MLALADAIEALTNTRPDMTAVITEATINSRQVIPGSLFVAIPGERMDGHDFIEDAFKRGATFALIQREVNASFRTLDLRDDLSIDSKLDLTLPLSARRQHGKCASTDRPLLAPQTKSPRDRNYRQCRQIHHKRSHCPDA